LIVSVDAEKTKPPTGRAILVPFEAAEARKCDLIVMASHGRRGVSAVVRGSKTVKVLTHSKIPVLVYR
jgi:nucleotide-binding universal stress UspA family protein